MGVPSKQRRHALCLLMPHTARAPSTSCAISLVLYWAAAEGMVDSPMPRLSKVQQVTSGRPAPSRSPARCATTGCHAHPPCHQRSKHALM